MAEIEYHPILNHTFTQSREFTMKRLLLLAFALAALLGTLPSSGQTPNPTMIQNYLAASDSGTGYRLYVFNSPIHNHLIVGNNLYCSWNTDYNTGLFMKIDGNSVYNVKSMQGVNMTDINGTIFFSGYDATNGWELWKSDGSDAGTALIKNTVTVPQERPCKGFTSANNLIYFFKLYDDPNAKLKPSMVYDLWKSNGTTAGTVKVKSFLDWWSFPFGGWNLNGNFVFIHGSQIPARGKPLPGKELWISNGTSTGTVILKDFNPGSGGGIANGLSPYGIYSGDYPYQLMADGKLYFAGNDGVKGEELCRSDGTAAGTIRLTDINPSGDAAPADLVRMGDYLYFAAKDGTSGTELWKYSLTSGTASRVKDINAGAASSDPCFLTVATTTQFGQVLFFAAKTPGEGVELWRSDGTEAGTVLVRDINPGVADSRPNSYIDPSISGYPYTTNFTDKVEFTVLDGKIYFSAWTPALGHELYVSDGTNAGTTLVKDIWPGTDATGFGCSSSPRFLAAVGGKLIFLACTPEYGWEWWKYDPSLPVTKSVARVGESGPAAFTLDQNYPNPFSAGSNGASFTTIAYSLDRDRAVTLRIFDALGRQVKTLFDGTQSAGTHQAFLEARGLPAGTYLCRLESEGATLTRRITLTR
jgi:ELWxxDGT repeat protein